MCRDDKKKKCEMTWFTTAIIVENLFVQHKINRNVEEQRTTCNFENISLSG